jgi:hypothetical protein
MAEPLHSEVPQAAPGPASNREPEIAALRRSGAEQLDPIRFHFIEALARRLRQHGGAVGRVLDGRLSAALVACSRRLDHLWNEARQTVARTSGRHPDAAEDLQRLFAAGDFAGIGRLVARLEDRDRRSPLAELARTGAQGLAPGDGGGTSEASGPRYELRSLRHFRNTWSQRSADRQVAQAVERAPANAGPLNSHMLVLRSLSAMRDMSPDYLNRFVSYADTLLRLEQAGRKSRPAASVTSR